MLQAIPVQSQSFMKSQVLTGSLLPQQGTAATGGRQKCLSHIPALRDLVPAADRASTDSKPAEQGKISALSRHQCKVSTPNDSA